MERNINVIGTALLKLLIRESIHSAAYYMRAANRTDLCKEDMIYALMYEAHEFMNRPHLEDEVQALINEETDGKQSESDEDATQTESESDEYDTASECSEIETVDDEECIFTRAITNDPVIEKMNAYHDTWDSWTPTDPLLMKLKEHVNVAIR
jgi:hypothetical protein